GHGPARSRAGYRRGRPCDASGDLTVPLAREKQARVGRREPPYWQVRGRLRTTPGAALQPPEVRRRLPESSLVGVDRPDRRRVGVEVVLEHLQAGRSGGPAAVGPVLRPGAGRP